MHQNLRYIVRTMLIKPSDDTSFKTRLLLSLFAQSHHLLSAIYVGIIKDQQRKECNSVRFSPVSFSYQQLIDTTCPQCTLTPFHKGLPNVAYHPIRTEKVFVHKLRPTTGAVSQERQRSPVVSPPVVIIPSVPIKRPFFISWVTC